MRNAKLKEVIEHRLRYEIGIERCARCLLDALATADAAASLVHIINFALSLGLIAPLHGGIGFLCPVVLRRYSAEFSAPGIILGKVEWSHRLPPGLRDAVGKFMPWAVGTESEMKHGLVLIAGLPIALAASFYISTRVVQPPNTATVVATLKQDKLVQNSTQPLNPPVAVVATTIQKKLDPACSARMGSLTRCA